MKTLKLDKTWDLTKDELNNIAIADGNERLAQDVASSVRVFKGEVPFDIERGVEYNNPEKIRETLQYDINDQAKLVEGVNESVTVFEEIENRQLKPVIYVTNTENGERIVIGE